MTGSHLELNVELKRGFELGGDWAELAVILQHTGNNWETCKSLSIRSLQKGSPLSLSLRLGHEVREHWALRLVVNSAVDVEGCFLVSEIRFCGLPEDAWDFGDAEELEELRMALRADLTGLSPWSFSDARMRELSGLKRATKALSKSLSALSVGGNCAELRMLNAIGCRLVTIPRLHAEPRTHSDLGTFLKAQNMVNIDLLFMNPTYSFDEGMAELLQLLPILQPGNLLILTDVWLPEVDRLCRFLLLNRFEEFERLSPKGLSLLVLRKTEIPDYREWDHFVQF